MIFKKKNTNQNGWQQNGPGGFDQEPYAGGEQKASSKRNGRRQ